MGTCAIWDSPDCDDTQPEVNPGHPEVNGDGLDNNCIGGDGPWLEVEPITLGGQLRLLLAVTDFPPREVVRFLASGQGPGAGPCAPFVADCAEILAPRQIASQRIAPNRTDLNVVTPQVPLLSGTRIWLQAISATAHSQVVPYVIP